jgi:hypothetical protein
MNDVLGVVFREAVQKQIAHCPSNTTTAIYFGVTAFFGGF